MWAADYHTAYGYNWKLSISIAHTPSHFWSRLCCQMSFYISVGCMFNLAGMNMLIGMTGGILPNDNCHINQSKIELLFMKHSKSLSWIISYFIGYKTTFVKIGVILHKQHSISTLVYLFRSQFAFQTLPWKSLAAVLERSRQIAGQ